MEPEDLQKPALKFIMSQVIPVRVLEIRFLKFILISFSYFY
jgi:hypothetical protein